MIIEKALQKIDDFIYMEYGYGSAATDRCPLDKIWVVDEYDSEENHIQVFLDFCKNRLFTEINGELVKEQIYPSRKDMDEVLNNLNRDKLITFHKRERYL